MISDPQNAWRRYRDAVRAGDFSAAIEVARFGAQLKRGRGDFKHATVWQRAVSNGFLLQGKYDEAVIEGKLALTLSGDLYEKALCLIVLGQAQTFAGRYRSALAYFGRAGSLARGFSGDIYLWTHLYGGRALAFRRTGKLDRAIVDWEGAAALLSRQGLFWRAALYVNNIGYLFMLGGHLKEAEQRVLEALKMVERDPHPHSEAIIYDSLGCVYARMARHNEAQTLLRRSAKMFEEVGDKSQMAQSLLHLGDLHYRMQEYECGRQVSLRGLDLAIEQSNQSLINEARDLLKKLTLDQMRPPQPETETVSTSTRRQARRVVRLEDYRGSHSRS